MGVITSRAGAALASVVLTLAVAMPLSAQQPTAPPPPPRAPDEVELRAFTEAYIDIQAIATELEAKVAAAPSEEEATKLKAEAEAKITAVLEQREVTKERYQEIGTLLEANAELRAQFEALQEKVVQERKSSG
jgi:hypothetical protein